MLLTTTGPNLKVKLSQVKKVMTDLKHKIRKGIKLSKLHSFLYEESHIRFRIRESNSANQSQAATKLG